MGKGGGVAIYVKSKFVSSVTLSITRAKQFEVLAIKVGVSIVSNITVVGCYRPLSATRDAFKAFSDILHELNDSSEFILMGDVNWDWLSGTSDCLKEFCESLSLMQLINVPTRLNPKVQHKFTLLDPIITNAAHKFISTGIFCNDISDHCVIACVRDTKLPKVKPHFKKKRYLEN